MGALLIKQEVPGMGDERPPNERADFSLRTRQILARRAAHRCSNPHCSALTIGPVLGPHDVSETGVAAHIYAASPGGPRGTGGQSVAQRQAPENGIWLCHRCGRLVDNNEGEAFPAPLLRSWRDLHDAELESNMEVTRAPSVGFTRLKW
jgi:hypothetical protein